MSFLKSNPYLTNSISKYSVAQQNDSNLRKGIKMYSQLISKLELARSAIIENDKPARTAYIKEAEKIIMQLKLCLDLDSKDEIILIFDKLYTSIIYSLHGIIIFDKPKEELDDIITDICKLKEEFEKIDQQEAEKSFTDQEGSQHIKC